MPVPVTRIVVATVAALAVLGTPSIAQAAPNGDTPKRECCDKPADSRGVTGLIAQLAAANVRLAGLQARIDVLTSNMAQGLDDPAELQDALTDLRGVRERLDVLGQRLEAYLRDTAREPRR